MTVPNIEVKRLFCLKAIVLIHTQSSRATAFFPTKYKMVDNKSAVTFVWSSGRAIFTVGRLAGCVPRMRRRRPLSTPGGRASVRDNAVNYLSAAATIGKRPDAKYQQCTIQLDAARNESAG